MDRFDVSGPPKRYIVCAALLCFLLLLTELWYLPRLAAISGIPDSVLCSPAAYITAIVSACLLGCSVGTMVSCGFPKQEVIPATYLLLVALLACKAGPFAQLKQPLLALWPVAMGLLAVSVARFAGRRGAAFYGIYFLIATAAGIPLLLHSLSWLSFEPVLMLYLILTANAALWCVPREPVYDKAILVLEPFAQRDSRTAQIQALLSRRTEKNRTLRKARLLWTLSFNLLWLFLFLRQPRVEEILTETLLPWLRYRTQAVLGSMTGDLTVIDAHYRDTALLRSPLSRICAMDGLPAALGVLAVIAAVLLLMVVILRNLPQEHGDVPLCRTLVAGLLIRSILGLAADVCLISSSSVYVLLLVQPWDLISVGAFLTLSWRAAGTTHTRRTLGNERFVRRHYYGSR